MLWYATGTALRLKRNMMMRVQRLDIRHRRDNSVTARKRPKRRASDEDGEGAVVYGVAWA